MIYSASPTVSQPVFLLDTTNKSPLSNHALMKREGTEKPKGDTSREGSGPRGWANIIVSSGLRRKLDLDHMSQLIIYKLHDRDRQ